MVDPENEGLPDWAHMLPKWWFRTPAELRSLRGLIPYHSMWKQYDEAENGNDPAVLEKQHRDAMLEADTTERDRAKGASAQEVALLRQTRERGQKFRSDARVPSAGSDDYQFMEDPDAWNKSRKL